MPSASPAVLTVTTPDQVIALIDSRDTEAAIRQAEAARDEARAALPEADAAIASSRFNVAIARVMELVNAVRKAIDIPLTVLADRKPTVDLAWPAISELEATANAVVPFRALVDDDYGVTRVELAVSRRFGPD